MDHSYGVTPAICPILSAQQLPSFGGDTHFSSMSVAYYAMSSGVQNMLGNLCAWHSDGSFVKSSNVGINPTQDAFCDPSHHPVTIKHPNTGAPCVYVNGDFTMNFDNWTVEESRPLLFQIFAYLTQSIFTTRVVWEPEMIATWDDRLVQHCATADYLGYPD